MGGGYLATGSGFVVKDFGSFSSEHPGITQFALADGSVRLVSRNVDFLQYVLSSAMHDGEVSKLD